MALVWSVHRKLKTILPVALTKKIRYIFETRLDSLWSREYYGQFGEDVILQAILESRYLGADKARTADYSRDKSFPTGFYVDVGAFAPKQYSNTFWFYKRGWRGINIDATPGSMKIFEKVRRRDINIEALVSSRQDEVVFYTWGNPTVFNTLSEEHAKKWERLTGKEPNKIILQTTSLAKILDTSLPKGQEIDFLSVDAESHDFEVLHQAIGGYTDHPL